MVDLTRATQPTIQAIYAEREKRGNVDKGHRLHLGGSVLGRECKRALWYSFRWVLDVEFSGRVLRLFERGHLEENRFVQELRWAGVEVYEVDPQTGKQFSFKECSGHVGGSLDGIAKGLLESPHKWHIIEFKTHSDKSFLDLKQNGVEQSKPEHFSQMQFYMGMTAQTGHRIERAFYLAVNKDNDELYSERIKFDERHFEMLLRKAWDIVQSPIPLERLSDDPTFFKCRFCDYKGLCHSTANEENTITMPALNCRTCVHATPEFSGNDGTWTCAKRNIILTEQTQRSGCNHHRFIPHLINWAEAVDASEEENWIEYEYNGKRFKNGERGPLSYPSSEFRQIVPDMIGDDFSEKLRSQFSGFYADNNQISIKELAEKVI